MLFLELVGQSNFLNLIWQGLSKASTHPVTFPKLEWGQPDPAQPDSGVPQWSVFLGMELQRLSQCLAFCYLLTNYLWLLLAGAGGMVWLHSSSASPPAPSLLAAQSSPKTSWISLQGDFWWIQNNPRTAPEPLSAAAGCDSPRSPDPNQNPEWRWHRHSGHPPPISPQSTL